MSLSLELILFVTGLGGLDVDDLLLNTLGGLPGWLACRLLGRRLRAAQPRRPARRGRRVEPGNG